MSADLFALMRATWPAAAEARVGGWTIREGQGGGSRVSAATWDGNGTPDIALAEAAMTQLGQSPIFMIRPQDETLDTLLEAEGYALRDPTQGFAAPVAALAQAPPQVTSFAIWPPLAIQAEIWAGGGIGPERLAVMERVSGEKTTLFGRVADKPAGTAFVATHQNAAMLHALEIAPAYRRRGLAQIMMRHAAKWAQDAGATDLYLLVTRKNVPALELYASLNMQPVGHYHYRRKCSEA